MAAESWSVILALFSNFAFASASLVYTAYSQKFSALWMNTVKSSVALVAAAVIFPLWWPVSDLGAQVVLLLMFSGLIGLGLGDWFLLRGFALLGASPVLMLFAFQPLMLAAFELEFFERSITVLETGAIACLIGCLFLFSRDQKKRTDSWNFSGFAVGILAVVLDALGVVISKWAFEARPYLPPGESHLYRCLGAVLGFVLVWNIAPGGRKFWAPFRGLPKISKRTVIGASLMGTFLSLLVYQFALKLGPMSLVSSVAVTGPLFAAFLEHIVRRKWPTTAMWGATALFLLGFSLLVLFPNS